MNYMVDRCKPQSSVLPHSFRFDTTEFCLFVSFLTFAPFAALFEYTTWLQLHERMRSKKYRDLLYWSISITKQQQLFNYRHRRRTTREQLNIRILWPGILLMSPYSVPSQCSRCRPFAAEWLIVRTVYEFGELWVAFDRFHFFFCSRPKSQSTTCFSRWTECVQKK